MVRTPCCKAEGLKKGAWTREEDIKLITYVNEHGEGGWRTLPEKAGLKRCGKSCRLRWANYLRPDIKRGEFSQDDEETIIRLHAIYGNKWSAIARRLPGRTDNEIKNYWNTHIKKRLIMKGIDPMTHKPISDKSDSGFDRKTRQDCPEATATAKSHKHSPENQKSPLSLSAEFLNKVANKIARRVNQNVLTEIIVGGGQQYSDNGNNNDNSIDSECERSVTSTSTSNLFNKITPSRVQSIFDGDVNPLEIRPSSTPTSMSTLSNSSVTVNDPLTCYLVSHSTGNEYNDIEYHRFMNSLSDGEDFIGNNFCVGKMGFINELAKTVHEDGQYETKKMMTNERDACTKGAFEDIDRYWDDYMDLENY